MAENQILVKFKPSGERKLINAINQLHLAQVKLEKGQRAYERALKKTNQQQVRYNNTTKGGVRNNRIMGGSIATLRSAMLLYSFAVGAVITKVINLTKEQAKLNNLAHGFDKLSEAGGFSVGMFENLRKATNNTMSDMDLFTQANNAMILGVGENTAQMAFMFDAAQRLGRVLGRTTKESVESLVTGIGRQSRLMLDNIGIIVKAEQAYEAYAKANNITADSLSEAERKAAFLQATMKGVTEAVSKLGPEVDNLQDDIQTLGSFFDNLTTSMVGYFGLTDNIKTVTEFYAKQAKELRAVDDEQGEVNKKFKEQQNEISRAKGLMHAYAETIRNAKFAKIGELNRDIKENNRLIASRSPKSLYKQDIDAWVELVNKNKELKAELEKTKNTWVSSDERVRELSDSINKMESELEASIEKFKFLRSQTINVNHELMLMGGEVIPNVSDELRGMGWDDYIKKVKESIVPTQDLKASMVDLFLTQKDFGKSTAEMAFSIGQSYDNMGEAINAALSQAIQDTIRFFTVKLMEDAITKFGWLGIPLAATAGAVAGSLVGQTKRHVKFEDGGLVGGRRHSQGGTMIEAERGEFVMSRNATEAIGIENLNRMNQGGGGAVNVTFTGNVMSQDFIENEAIPQIKDAIRRGADIGVS